MTGWRARQNHRTEFKSPRAAQAEGHATPPKASSKPRSRLNYGRTRSRMVRAEAAEVSPLEVAQARRAAFLARTRFGAKLIETVASRVYGAAEDNFNGGKNR